MVGQIFYLPSLHKNIPIGTKIALENCKSVKPLNVKAMGTGTVTSVRRDRDSSEGSEADSHRDCYPKVDCDVSCACK